MRGAPVSKLEFHRTRGTTYLNRNLFPAAEEELQKWLDEAVAQDDYLQAASAANAIGCCYTLYRRYEKALAYFDRADSYLEMSSCTDLDLASKVLANRISVIWEHGETDKAWDEIQSHPLHHCPQSSRLLLLRGGLALERNDLVQAQADFMQSIVCSEQQKKPLLSTLSKANLGIVHAQRGDLQVAEDLLKQSLDVFSGLGDAKDAAHALTELGMLAQKQGQYPEALEYCAQALKCLLANVASIDRKEMANVCKVLAFCFKRVADKERADNYARRAMNYYTNQVSPYLVEQGRVFAQEFQSLSDCKEVSTSLASSFFQWEYHLTYLESIITIIDSAERMDHYTLGHSSRVLGYCDILARELGLEQVERENLLFASRFHDLGKAWLPKDILLKPSSLNEFEWTLMKQHPQYGADMVRMLVPGSPAAELIACHHERYDGKGYPRSLNRDSIPYAACILSVADAYDAMTSNRAYREAMSHGLAMQILRAESGLQFHPEVVEAWFKVHNC